MVYQFKDEFLLVELAKLVPGAALRTAAGRSGAPRARARPGARARPSGAQEGGGTVDGVHYGFQQSAPLELVRGDFSARVVVCGEMFKINIYYLLYKL